MSSFVDILRAFGLDILNATRRSWTQRSGPETPKKVLNQTLKAALSRALFHLVPMTSLSVMIYQNYHTLYIGPYFTQDPQKDPVILAIIQVAAKFQELLCVSSLTAIVLQALPRELLGDGVPLGLLGSGLSFSGPSWFWSTDFVVAARWMKTSWARAQLYILLILAGGIAVFIGPAAAVLFLPRSQNILAGKTTYSLNGSVTDFWPSSVSAGSEPSLCGYTNSSLRSICPSGGYEALRQTLTTFNYTDYTANTGIGNAYQPQLQAQGIRNNRQEHNLLTQNTQGLIPPVLSTMHIRPLNWGTAAISPHAASVAVSQYLIREWANIVAQSNSSHWSKYQWSYGLFAETTGTSPVVKARCTQAQNLSMDAEQAAFRYLYRATDSSAEFTPPAPEAATTYSLLWARDVQMANISTLDRSPSSRVRTQWLALQTAFVGNAKTLFPLTGLLLEFPWDGESRAAITCSVSAVWHNYTVVSERSTDYGAWVINLGTGNDYNSVHDYNDVQHNRPITLESSWLSLLTSKIPVSDADNGGTLLDSILDDTGYTNAIYDLRHKPQQMWDLATLRCVQRMMHSNWTDTELWNDIACGKGQNSNYMEFVLASLVADGLSRFGSHRVFDLAIDEREWRLHQPFITASTLLLKQAESAKNSPPNGVMQPLSIYVEGLAFSASSATDYLALVVAVSYILIAGLHVVWVLGPGNCISSAAWDTVTELLTLAIVSPAPISKSLANTAAGIHRFKTYGTIVKVRASSETADKQSKQNLRLVLDDDLALSGLAASSSVGPAGPNMRHRTLQRVTAEVEYS
ncbi:hypothetical protein LTR95_002845 [Oleoguttula sp. CCFEE 5521]